MTTERTRTPQETRSPVVFFALAAALFLPFPVLAHFVHVPGLPKNAPVTDFVAAFVPAVAALILTYRARARPGRGPCCGASSTTAGSPARPGTCRCCCCRWCA